MDNSLNNIIDAINDLALIMCICESPQCSENEEIKSSILKIDDLLMGKGIPEAVKEKLVPMLRDLRNSDENARYELLKVFASSAPSIIAELASGDTAQELDSESDTNTIASADGEELSGMPSALLNEFYSAHQEMIAAILASFSEIREMGTVDSKIPGELHQELESYLMRLNQDAIQIDAKPLVDLAQSLFGLLMSYPLLDIQSELEELSQYILGYLSGDKEISSASGDKLPESMRKILNICEAKLSGNFNDAGIKEDSAPLKVDDVLSDSSEKEVANSLGFYTVEADNEILSEFIAEATDHLNAVEGILLERDLDFSSEDIDTLFRGVHSLKGTSGYFNLLEINESSHLLENILDEVRAGKRDMSQELKALVLRYVDIQNDLMKSAQMAVASGGTMQRSLVVQEFINDIEDFFNGVTRTLSIDGVKLGEQNSVNSQELGINQLFETGKALVLDNTTQSVSGENAQNSPGTKDIESGKPAAVKSKENSTSSAKSFVKIDTERLDSLGEMIGEMVIYSSMLIRKCRESMLNDESAMRLSDQVEKFSRELQDIGMSMRLDPIRGLFQKLSRLVWDTSKKLGKDIQFVVKGEDTELDRNVIERLADPLMHMVRNSLDHGIEDPATRIAAGKAGTGIIELSSTHEGGSIVIKIKDDGRGLDTAKLFSKAVEKGIVSQDAVLSEQEIFQLIFAPGFSTAEKVTDISGRGVGMDVVRTNIESMRGRIHIESRLGEGSTFSIELPLTLAIIDGIECSVGMEKFIIPMISVVELVMPTVNMIGSSLHASETFFFRGKHLPMYRLSTIFSIKTTVSSPLEGEIVILNNSGELIALLVDQIGGNCQTVIKALGPLFAKQGGIAGCAIVNNGDIGLIVDVRSLIQVARADQHGRQMIRQNVAQLAE